MNGSESISDEYYIGWSSCMNEKERKEIWKSEESVAYIHGWDFSYINNRYVEEQDLPWDYRTVVDTYRKPEHRLLDIDTGGGEFLLSLNHPAGNTSATEGFAPNVKLCKELLLPLGIQFKEAKDYSALPFLDESFDVIINRHGEYDVKELYRLLKPGGWFITEQVGEENDRELVELLLPSSPKPFPGFNLREESDKFLEAGFTILRGEEAFCPIKFFDVGALVWFARIIMWEFPGFSVDTCFDRLLEAQRLVEQNGCVEGSIHRFLIVAQK